jgi:Retroviral aspartyl protease
LKEEDMMKNEELESNSYQDPNLNNFLMNEQALNSLHRTLKFQGQIGNLAIITMIDSGSSHSFIHPSFVQLLSLSVISSEPLTVITTSGAKLSTTQLCHNLHFQLQGYTFVTDLRIFQVTDHDLILGMDWLNSYSPLTYDGTQGYLSLTLKGKSVFLDTKIVAAEIKLCTSSLNLQKEV